MGYFVRKQNKYGAVTKEYGGFYYHSKKEAAKARGLDLLKAEGSVLDWKQQVKISIDVNGHHICNYYVDFLVFWKGGDKEYIEVKGYETEVWRLKWKLFEAIMEGKGYKLTIEK